MARKGSQYSAAELAEIYRDCAWRKGWDTTDRVVKDKVDSWHSGSIGPVGLAIDWHESGGKDPKPELGNDATVRKGSTSLSGAFGCFALGFATLLLAAAAIAGLVAIASG